MPTLTIAALSTPQTITLSALAACREAERLYVQTAQSPCILPLEQAGLRFTAMDDLYDNAEDFDALNGAIAARLGEGISQGDITYALPGRGPSPALLQEIRQRLPQAQIRLLPGVGYGQAAQAALGWPGGEAWLVTSATNLPQTLNPYVPLCVEEVDTPIQAGELKLRLSEYWPEDWDVFFGLMDREGTYQLTAFPLYELDRQKEYRADGVLLLPPAGFDQLERYGYQGLVEVMARLRAPGGCPWDREQTHQSIEKSLIEECYEVLDAIDRKDDDALCEELGDVLLQVAFHAQIAAEQGRFTNRDVTTGIVQKLVYRHPHIFGSGQADTSDEVLVKWEQLKKKEKHFSTQAQVLQAVPKNLPALMYSYKVQKKAAQVGFDWDSASEAFPKLEEEIQELQAAMAGQGNVAEEMGDLLFAAVNVARLLGTDPEFLLKEAAEKFLRRFAAMEALAGQNNLKLENMTLAEQDVLWNAVKTTENRAK